MEESPEYSFENNVFRLEASHKNPVIIYLLILLGVAGLGFLIWIYMQFPLEGKEPNLGIAMTILAYMSVGIYFLRMGFWGLFGKEILVFENDRILFYNDFKLFKDNRNSLDISTFKAEVENSNKNKLIYRDNDLKIISTVKLSADKVKEISNEIMALKNNFYSDK